MNRNHSALRALLIAAASLLATGASAQDSHPQGKAPTAGEKAEKAADKTADKVEKAADKAADKVEKAADKAAKDLKAGDPAKAKSADDRAARKAKEHDAQRDRLSATWKGPMTDALRQELRRHAERLARLERIKAVADAEKDKDSSEKAAKLVARENERHEKWMTHNAATAGGVVPVTTPVPVPAAAADKKEGVK
ncbi:MAG: hypothetical protein K0S65_2851 [Labilithrix sp.]|nr:hypothetical protein [Labilithrix sp.]